MVAILLIMIAACTAGQDVGEDAAIELNEGRPADHAKLERAGLPVLRAGSVKMNDQLADALDRGVRHLDTLHLQLFEDVSLKVTDVVVQIGEGRTSLIAGGLNVSYTVSLVASDQGIGGTVVEGDATYQLLPEGRGAATVAEVDIDALPPEGEPVPVPPESSLQTSTAVGQHGSTAAPLVSVQTTPDHEHDLLVVFSDDVASAASDPVSLIASGVGLANIAYDNSGVAIDLVLAAAEQIEYEESGDLGEDLDALKATNDGVLDDVHRLRDRAAADLVLLMVQNPGGSCGKANLHLVSSDADDDSAFAVMGVNCLSQHTLAHELGHIAGAHHDTAADPFPVPRYAHGWVRADQFGPNVGWRSVMAYLSGDCDNPGVSCPRNPPAFSNPDVTIGAGAIGNDSANNARRLNETAQTLAGFRLRGPRVSLYEGNEATQDHVCVVSLERDSVIDFTTGSNERRCDNDEARSVTLFNVPAGKVLRLLDDPRGNRQDDFVEIEVKRDVSEAVIGSLERSFEDDDVRVVYRRNNGLDGKVSRLEVDSAVSGPTVDLHEGNGGTQNLVCTLPVGESETIRFPGHPECDNDEARSVILRDVPADRVLRVFDDPDGSRQDDWTEIETKRDVGELLIPTFEESFDNDDVRVSYHRHNGLDGKISRLEVDTGSAAPTIDLQEGNNASQDLVCTIVAGEPRIVRFPGHPECDNDEARSMTLHGVRAGTVVLVFDHPEGSLDDDWLAIRVKRDLASVVVDTFEASVSNADVDIVYARNNGLDGKVSRVELTRGDRLLGVVSFFEGNNATQNKVCDLQLGNSEVRFRGHGDCDNDEGRSLVLSLAPAGAVVRVFDDPDCETGDDVTIIEIKRDVFLLRVDTFERSFENADVRVTYRRDNGLDGKVSCVQLNA